MELFILGPAFGLPSIDAECNATVALLQLRASGSYSIIPIHHQAHPLPCLVDGQSSISGFNNIARHLHGNTLLDDRQRADTIAIASLTQSAAQTLLDISLYVGFENYRLATQPAFTRILPLHANYIIPPQRRSAARARTEHLGISSIDVDNVHEDMSNRPPGFEAVGKEPGFEAETQKRASLLLPQKETLRSLLQQPQHAAIFKLHALAENFFEPLQDILGDRPFILGTDQPTATDCLLYGYLALMVYPQLPQDWLAATLKQKYKKVAAYVERVHKILNLSTNTDDVLRLASSTTKTSTAERGSKLTLPWRSSTKSTFAGSVNEIFDGMWSHIPFLGKSNQLLLLDAKRFPFFQENLQVCLITAAASFAAAGYLALRTGWLLWPRGEETHVFGHKRLSDYGHLGAALAGINWNGNAS